MKRLMSVISGIRRANQVAHGKSPLGTVIAGCLGKSYGKSAQPWMAEKIFEVEELEEPRCFLQLE